MDSTLQHNTHLLTHCLVVHYSDDLGPHRELFLVLEGRDQHVLALRTTDCARK